MEEQAATTALCAHLGSRPSTGHGLIYLAYSRATSLRANFSYPPSPFWRRLSGRAPCIVSPLEVLDHFRKKKKRVLVGGLARCYKGAPASNVVSFHCPTGAFEGIFFRGDCS